jgi:hypothetical protein
MSDTKKFKWDDSALVPDFVDVTFPTEVTGGEPETVRQWELSRPDLVDFVSEAMDRNFVQEVEKEVEGVMQKVTERIPFKKVSADQEALLFKYLAKSSRGAKDEKFYKNLKLGAGGLIALVDMFLQLNHLDEITASGGNWFMLPTIRQMLSEAEKDESESPKPTMPVS